MFLEILFFLILGLLLGSFTTAVIYREENDQSWWSLKTDSEQKHRSKCPSCGAVIHWYDLVPFFSWLFLRGKCRACGASVSWTYPVIEACVTACILLVVFVQGLHLEAVPLILAVPFLMALFVIDLRHYILPNRLVLIVGAIGVVKVLYSFIHAPNFDGEAILAHHIGGAGVYMFGTYALGVLTKHVLKKDALGMGDVKLFGVAGLWLGLDALPEYFILCGAMGVVLSLLWRGFKKAEIFPFGPALIVSLYLLLLFDGSLFL